MYGRKNVLFTCVCLGFPRENFYTGYTGSRLGGGVVTCGSPLPGPFDTFCKGFGIPGDSWVFSTTLSFIHFTYVLANHSVGIPRDSPVFYDPWGLYFLRACVFFWCSWVSWKSLAPCFLYFSCFLYTKVVWPEKTWFCFCWCLPSASSFWRQKIGQQRVKLRKNIEIRFRYMVRITDKSRFD